MTKLPEGVEAALKFYLVSDKTGIETVVTLGGMTSVDEETFAKACTKGLAATEGLAEFADDFRPMTREEIKDYIKRQDEDEE